MNEIIIVSVLQRTLIAGTPLLLGTLGEIYAERSGVLNLGIEGIMSVGAVAGFATALATGNPLFGMLAAVISGILLSLLHAFVSITIKANQVVSGLALTMIGLGISGLWGKRFIGMILQDKLRDIPIPFLHKLPFAGSILFNRDLLFYISLLLGAVLWFILFKTRWGINIRSCGESPKTADAMGLNVNAIRYICVMIGGGMAGLAGSYVSLYYIPTWIEGMIGGRGWIVVALTIFSLWNPTRAFLGAYLFGGIYVLQYILQPLGISPNVLLMLPYITTLGVLLISSGSKNKVFSPKALGVPYFKEDHE